MTKTDGMVQYHFRDAIGGFFEFPTENARAILPPELQPIEPHHGSSVLSVMAFDFHDSPVGDYGELILSILVSPRVEPGVPMPRSAFYPFRLATTTRESREHAIERWHLPHWMEDVDIAFDRQGDHIAVKVKADGAPVADMTIYPYAWKPVSHLHQSFMKDGDASYFAQITMEGEHSEHEDEKGIVKLYDHPFNKELAIPDVYEVPFREQWMREGVQTFQPLVQLEAA